MEIVLRKTILEMLIFFVGNCFKKDNSGDAHILFLEIVLRKRILEMLIFFFGNCFKKDSSGDAL